MEKCKQILASYIIDFTFLQNIHIVALFVQPGYQATRSTYLYVFKQFGQHNM